MKGFWAFFIFSVGMEKAINNTTVEVTYKEAIADVKALNFTIEGLEVKNAVVKQSDSKTVVLTTAAQEAGKVYTVKEGEVEQGKFTGVEAVLPTSLTLVERSVQGVVGQEVTLQAKVTVKEGQSAAGIPVTFNIPSTNSSFNQPIVAEVTTNADGVATYSYTRYADATDNVVVYATGDRTKSATGVVYWAAAKQLTITDVTGVNSLVNNDSKVYEINSKKYAGKYVFVTFKENVGVTTDKFVRDVQAKGTNTFFLNSDGSVSSTPTDYPYELSTGNSKAVIAVKLDANGKGSLVLAGKNASVTPVVYEGTIGVDGTDAGNIAGDSLSEYTSAVYSATALQATAPTVKFEAKHVFGLTLAAEGVSNAATYVNADETGGRDYTATYVDENGKPVKAGTPVNIALPNNTVSGQVYLLDADGNLDSGSLSRDGKYRIYTKTVSGTEGKVKFTVASRSFNQYVEPIVFIDNGTGKDAVVGQFDPTDLQTAGEATHFTTSVEYSTSLTLVDSSGKEIKSVLANGAEQARFLYETVDQNGKARAYRVNGVTEQETTLTYTVKAGYAPVKVGATTISAGDTAQFTVTIPRGEASGYLAVTSDYPTNATVYATATVPGLILGTTNTVTADFGTTSFANVKDVVTKVDTAKGLVYVQGVPYSLIGATYLNNGTTVPTLSSFYAHLVEGATVQITKDADGNLVFNVVPATVVTPSLVTKAEVTGADTVQVTFSGAVNTSPTASQFAIDFNGNGTIETNEYATAASGSSSVLTLTFASVHNLSTSTVTVPNLKYTPTVAGTLLSVASTNVTTAFTTPVTVATAAHGVTIAAGTTAPTVGAAAVALNNALTIPAGTVTTAGNVIVTLKADKAGVTSAIEVPVAVSLLDDEKVVASKIVTELNKLAAITDKFTVTAADNKVTVKAKTVDAADVAANLAVGIADPAIATTPTFTAVFSGLTAVTAGTTTAGSLDSFAKTNAKFTAVTGTGTVNPLVVKVLSNDGSTLVDTSVTVAVAAGDAAATVASKVKAALEANAAITANYTVTIASDEVTLTNKVAEAVTTTITVQ